MDYRAFIQSMLARAKINQKYRQAFTDAAGMKIFLTAVTHPTHNAENNYQELEFIGDGIIKGILSQYIPRRFPKLASGESKYSKKGTGEGVLSKTRRFLEQRKTLSDFALKLGFWGYVQADEETLTKLRKETLEDVFEAFVGALVEVVDQRIKRGLGYAYAYNFVTASLDEIEIEINTKTLDDPITRLNELYKANELKNGKTPIKWGDALYSTHKLFLPKVADGQLSSEVPVGTVVYYEPDKSAYVFTDQKKWVHVSRAPLMAFQPPPQNLEDPQMMWYSGVFGFLDQQGKPVTATMEKSINDEGEEVTHWRPTMAVSKENKDAIQKNPAAYHADIIGQGIHFKLKESKKMSASQALNYLARLGYQKE